MSGSQVYGLRHLQQPDQDWGGSVCRGREEARESITFAVKAETKELLTPPLPTVILLHPPLSLVGASTVMERGYQQNNASSELKLKRRSCFKRAAVGEREERLTGWKGDETVKLLHRPLYM